MSSVQSVHKWMMKVNKILRHFVPVYIGSRTLALYSRNLGISPTWVGITKRGHIILLQ
jgi:hypothetical protein